MVLMMVFMSFSFENGNAQYFDSDYDGLDDDYEISIGTDPRNPDTDGDGIIDSDDSTPTGAFIAVEEVYEMFEYESKITPIVCAVGDKITFSVNVKKDGIPLSRTASVYVYVGTSYELEQKKKMSISIIDGLGSVEYNPTEIGNYYFLCIVNESSLNIGIRASKYEFETLVTQKRATYDYSTVYPKRYATVESLQTNLLPYHNAEMRAFLYEYSNSNLDSAFLERYRTNWNVNPKDVLDTLYRKISGKVYAYRLYNTQVTSQEVEVSSSGTVFTVSLGNTGLYTIYVSPEQSLQSYDFVYSYKFPYDRAYVYSHNVHVVWHEFPIVCSLFENVPLKIFSYRFSDNIPPSTFNELYNLYGPVEFVKQYPQYAVAEQGLGYISILYYSKGYYARLGGAAVSIDGVGTYTWNFDVPGKYVILGEPYSSSISIPSGKFDWYSFSRISCSFKSWMDVNSEHELYLLPDTQVFFKEDSVKTTITFVDGSGTSHLPMKIYCDGSLMSTTSIPLGEDNLKYNFGILSKGEHRLKAIALLSERVESLISIFGIDGLEGNWIGSSTVEVADLAIYARVPTSLVRGLNNEVRIVAYRPGEHMTPCTGARVEILIEDSYHHGNPIYTEQLWLGILDNSGSAHATFTGPLGRTYFNNMIIKVVWTEGVKEYSEALEIPIYVRSEDVRGLIMTDKEYYKPGDLVHVRFLAWNLDTSKPLDEVSINNLGGSSFVDYVNPFVQTGVELSFVDPYYRTIYKDSFELNEYGGNSTDIPLGEEISWGKYTLMLRAGGNTIATHVINVEEYKLPATKLYIGEDENKDGETEEITVTPGVEKRIPIKVEYMFGVPVTEGVVTYKIFAYQRNYYPLYFDIYPDYIEYSYEEKGYGAYWSYYGAPIEISNGTIILNHGLGNITFIPICDMNIVKYEIVANFSDRFEHFNSETKFVYVGSVPVEGAKLILASEQVQYLPKEDIRFNVSLMVTETNLLGEEITIPLSGKGLLVELSAREQSGDWQTVSSCNLVTDEHGLASFNMSNFNISLNQILSNGLVHFLVKVSTNDTTVQELNATKQFTICTREHKLSTDKTHYATGEYVNITMSITDLLSATIPTGNYTLSIFSGNREIIYSDYYYWMPRYYSYSYGYDYFDDACIYIHTGVLTGSETLTWHVPLGLPDGDYTIEFTFGGYSIYQKIQVITQNVIEMEITTPNSFSESEQIKVDIDLSENFNGFLYVDIITGTGIIPFSRKIEGTHASFEFTAPFSKLPLFVHAYMFDSSGRVFEESRIIYSNFSMPELKISVNKTECSPGDTIQITASLSGDIPNGSLPLFGLEIVDAALFEIAEDDYYPSYDYYEDYYNFGKSEYYPYYSYYYQRNIQAKDFFENFRYPNARYHRLVTNWNVKKVNFEELENTTVRYWPEHSEKIEQMPIYNTTNWVVEDMTYAGGLAPQFTKENLRSELEKTKLREWFTDQAFWLAFMPGENSVTIEVRLPDNICKWRISGISIMENCIGVTNFIEINSAKEFYIEPSLPDVLTQDDEVNMKVRIYNLREKSANVTVGVYADDWLLVRGPELKTIPMTAWSVDEVTFEVIIKKCGERNMTIIASDFVDVRDAVKKTYKIRPNGALKTSHESGIVDENEFLDVSYYNEHIEGSEKTVLRLAAGFEGLLLEGASSLMGYPYGCTEQTMSKLLPDILLWEYYSMLGKLDYYTRKTLIEYITSGIGRLYSMQHGDNGWGWWSADTSDVWMTAYVLFGLAKAREVGFFIDSNVIQSAQSYLISQRSSDGSWQGTNWFNNDRIALTSFVYYALVQSNASISSLAPTTAYLASKWSSGSFKEPYSVAFYGLAKERLHEPITQQVNWLISHMSAGHWAQGSSLGGADETTGWATLLLAKAGKKTEVRGALEWLAKGRRYGGWGTTSDTIACMLAINEVVKIAEPIDMLVSVFVGNIKIKEMLVTKENINEFKSAFDALDLTPYLGENGGLVSIRKLGKGDLFFELTTIQYLRTDVSCIYPQNVNAVAGVPYEFQIVADPQNSIIVDVAGLDIFIDEDSDTTILSRQISKSDLNDGPTIFTYTLVSTSNKLTFTLTYRCDAGERESGVIRKGYSADINLTGNAIPMKAITKSVSEQLLSIGEKITVTISGFANGTSTLVDTIPPGLDAHDIGDAKRTGSMLEWTVSGKFSKSYKLKANDIFFDRWSRAYLLNDGFVYAVSNSLTLTASKEDFTLLREYSTIFPKDYQPIEVTIHILSKYTKYYLAIEDTLPPGCSIDTSSINTHNNQLNSLTYTQKGDKIVFFLPKIECGKTLKIRYKIIPKILGSFSTPPAKAYPMYSESEVAYSIAEMLIVNHVGAQASPDDDGDGGLGVIPQETDMNALILLTAGCACGLLLILLADTRQNRLKNNYKENLHPKKKKVR